MQIAKGPNILNLHAYAKGQQQYEQEDNPTDTERIPLENSQSIEDQFDKFIKEINKYDQVLKNVADDLNEMEVTEQFIHDFYPEFIVNSNYETDQQKKIVLSSNPEMGKVITNLQRTNKVLKDEIKGWSIEFAKTTKLSQTLLSQNEILRKAICTKNKQLLKLIQIISTTQNMQITEMKENLEILREENGVLLDHLEKIKEQFKQKKQDCERLKAAFEEKRTEMIEVERENGQIQDKQEHLSKTVALIQDSLQELQKRKRKLQKQKQRLTQLKQEYTRDQSSIQARYKQTEQDKIHIEQELKQKFQQNQESKHQLIQKIDEQTEKIQKIKEDTRKIQVQIERKQNRLQEFNKINKDLKARSEQNKDVIEKIVKEHVRFVEEQGTLQAGIYLLQNDVDQMKSHLKELEKTQNELHESFRHSMKTLEQNNHNSLNEQKARLSKQSKDLLKKIFQEKLQLSLKDKEVQDWKVKVTSKKEEMNQLKAQIKEIRANQSKLAELKLKLSEQSNEY